MVFIVAVSVAVFIVAVFVVVFTASHVVRKLEKRDMKRIARGVAFAAGLAVALPLAAGTYHWTGAEDGFWTNANNWAEGAVPGRYETPDGRVGAEGDTAVFGDALAGKAVTAIDFDGVYSVLRILTEGAHRYVYGTAADQYVPIEPYGVFSAAETAATPAAAIQARLRLGVELMTTNWGGETMTVRNNAVDEFALGTWGYNTRATDHGSGGEPGARFEGSGPIRLAGACVMGNAGGMMVTFASTGLLTLDAPTKVRLISIPALSGVLSPQRIEITANGTLEPYSCYNFLNLRRATVVSGAGPFRFGVGNRGGLGVCCECEVHAPLTLLCPVETAFLGTPPDDYVQRLFLNWGGGTLTFAGGNALKGLVRATHGSSPTLSAGTLGLRGTFGDLGDVDFLFSSATLRYTGAGETTDRTVTLTNSYVGVTGRVALEQAGTGPLTMAGAVALADGMTAGTLVLKGTSLAPATFAGTLDAGIALAKEGTGFWTFAPQGDFTGAVSVSGGTLAFDASLHLASLTAVSGTTRIRVEAGRTLTVDALSVADGKTLDFLLMDAAASVRFPNETADAPLANVTLNGHPVRLDDAGTLQAVTDGDNVWKTSVSGGWDDAANWVGEALPDPSRTTYIDAPGDTAYTVVLGGEEARETTLTNLVVNNIGTGTATLRVTNATVTVAGHTAQDPVLRLGAGGRLDVVDAVLRVWDLGNAQGNISDRTSVDLNGGELAVRGASTFITRGIDESRRTDGASHNLNTRFTFGTGTLAFSDDAVFQTERETSRTVFYHVFMPTRAGEAVDVAFRDRARLDLAATPWEFVLAGNGGRATLLLDSAYEGVMKGLGNRNLVGRGTGLGEYLVRRGQVETGTYDFLHIGTPGTDQRTTATLFATGRVEIAQGASMKVHGCYPLNDNSFYGVAVGNAAALTGVRGTSYVHGELRVAGTFTQERGNFLVAEGANADGEVFHDGGTVSIVDNPGLEGANTRGEVAIGAFGGHGRYTLTAGAFSTGHNVYLGGATTNDLFRWHANGDVLQQYHDARGVLAVSGGSFTTAKNLILGRDGTGVLALTGSGSVSAAAIVVSNTVGQAASEIRFTVDAERRCGKIDPATQVVFLPGARVVVDVTAEAAQKTPRRVPVWSFDTVPEGLENVAFDLVGAEGVRAPNGLALSDDGRTLAWNVSHGTILLFR